MSRCTHGRDDVKSMWAGRTTPRPPSRRTHLGAATRTNQEHFTGCDPPQPRCSSPDSRTPATAWARRGTCPPGRALGRKARRVTASGAPRAKPAVRPVPPLASAVRGDAGACFRAGVPRRRPRRRGPRATGRRAVFRRDRGTETGSSAGRSPPDGDARPRRRVPSAARPTRDVDGTRADHRRGGRSPRDQPWPAFDRSRMAWMMPEKSTPAPPAASNAA